MAASTLAAISCTVEVLSALVAATFSLRLTRRGRLTVLIVVALAVLILGSWRAMTADADVEGSGAEGSGAVWTMQVNGNHDDGSPFITAMFTYAGGVGARFAKPGLSAVSYPTGVSAVPIEVVEASAPIRFRRKELRPGSGGRGRQVGGLGQTIEFTVDTEKPWQLNAVTSRLDKAPEGIFGGEAGSAGAFTVNGEPVRTQARVTLQPGDHVRLDLPGGGGYGAVVESVG